MPFIPLNCELNSGVNDKEKLNGKGEYASETIMPGYNYNRPSTEMRENLLME